MRAQSLIDLPTTAPAAPEVATRWSIFEGYIGVLIVSFLVAVIATPIMRKMALANGVVDRPNERKVHRVPVAYLGGVAVYLGILAGFFYSFLSIKFDGLIDYHATKHALDPDKLQLPVPLSILMGMTVIMLVGVIDDVTGISPRVKIGGQLFAAAALAYDEVGVKLAGGMLRPIGELVGNPDLIYRINLGTMVPVLHVTHIDINVVYWVGTAFIALGVLGLCNASNLIDGLDGLLSGTTAISSIGLLVVSLGLALVDDGPRDSQRIILCLAILGACLGFLPHNFNPATIFLGDAGSLLLGFMTCVVIMMLGDTGKTHLVAAGLIIYALPIIDTSLAIVRRKLEGKPISAADNQHLHHMLKRALGVKGAVAALYGIVATFAVLGASISLIRARGVYFLALLMAAYIGVTAIKISRRRAIESQGEAPAAGGTPAAGLAGGADTAANGAPAPGVKSGAA